jgi:hypothetical protein
MGRRSKGTPVVRAAVLLIPICLVSGCARPDYAEQRLDYFLLSAGPQPGYAIKPVIEKQGRITLVGDDGSVCRTSAKRFARTKVGSWIACSWMLPLLDSIPVVRAGG